MVTLRLIRRAYIGYGHHPPHQESIPRLWSPSASLGDHKSTILTLRLIRRAYIDYGHPPHHQESINRLWSSSTSLGEHKSTIVTLRLIRRAYIDYRHPPNKYPLNTKYIRLKIPRIYLFFTFHQRNDVPVQDQEDKIYYLIDTLLILSKDPPSPGIG